MMTDEEASVTDDTTLDDYIGPDIRWLPLSAFIRGNYRYEGESYEDYKEAMKIQKKIRRLIRRYGGDFKIRYEPETNIIHWV